MEEGLYRVDVNGATPQITRLRADGNHGGPRDLPGRHGKGLFSGQGRVYYTNNGAAGSTGGGLVEWDGIRDPSTVAGWTVVDSERQYTEVTGPAGPVDADPLSSDPVWALGWDDESVVLRVRDAVSGAWSLYRLPKGSYTHGHPNGWYTEWPRIRDVGPDIGYLMNHHGTMFTFPAGFKDGATAGIRPAWTFLKMIVDYVEDGDQLVFACNDSSKFRNPLVARSNSNLMFVDKGEFGTYGGRPRGAGGVWVDDAVVAGVPSDPLLLAGYLHRSVHLAHDSTSTVEFAIEIDRDGRGSFSLLRTVSVPARGYAHVEFDPNLDGEWIRFRTDRSVASATAYVLYGSAPNEPDPGLTPGLVPIDGNAARSQGFLRSRSTGEFELEFAADILDASGSIAGTGYYRAGLNPTTSRLELVAVQDTAAEAGVRNDASTTRDFGLDAASAWITDGGTRLRLPKRSSAYDTATASGPRRGEREIVTERQLWNIHGTLYEVPREFTGGGLRRIRPVTTHDLDIFDYASWRGMLVLSGQLPSLRLGEHVVRSDDGRVGLWFGNVDDLWKLGAPRGEGGPWAATAVVAGAPSDPYLMYGYEDKKVELSHSSSSTVRFTVEVDFLGDNSWHEYDTFAVAPGAVFEHRFPAGYSAHWVRVTSDRSTVATAHFTYTDTPLFDPTFGDGCADVSLRAGSQPRLGSSFLVFADGVPDGLPTIGFFGFETRQWGGIPLPFTLHSDCALFTSIDLTQPLAPASGGAAQWFLPLPPVPELVGLTLYQQVIVPNPAVPFGAEFSDAARVVLGGD